MKNHHAVTLGKKGGQIGGRSRSPAKIATAKANGKKGGRPKKEARTLERELTTLTIERDQLRAEVERWQAEAEEMSAQRSHNANQAGILRAEVERLKPYVSKAILTVEGTMRCSPQVAVKYNDAIARAEKAEAALVDWSLLNTWGGTPEIIHEFIKGQQNRIHYCQDLETELTRLRAEVSEARRAWLGDDYGHLPLIEALEKFRSDSDAESDRADVLYQRSCEVEHALRAELASKTACYDIACGEVTRLRADLERFTGHGLLDCHAICDQRDAAIARAERAYVERLKKQIRDDNLGYACEL